MQRLQLPGRLAWGMFLEGQLQLTLARVHRSSVSKVKEQLSQSPLTNNERWQAKCRHQGRQHSPGKAEEDPNKCGRHGKADSAAGGTSMVGSRWSKCINMQILIAFVVSTVLQP